MEEEHVYTQSAKVDKIVQFFKKDKELGDILLSFRGNPSGTFLFNPMGDDLIFDFWMENPEEFKGLIKVAVVNFLYSMCEKKTLNAIKQHLKIAISDSKEIKMHDWSPEYEGIPVAVKCQVIGAFDEETYTKYAEVYCVECGAREKDVTDLGRPYRCPTRDCDSKGCLMKIDPYTLKTESIRVFLIQEPLEEAKHGNPKILPCVIKGPDVAKTFFGQHKKIIGTFRSQPQKNKPTNRIMINAISVADRDAAKPIQPTNEQIEYFKKLVKKDNFEETILDSYSPEIKYGGTELAKLCLILSILGGNKIGRIRGRIHALLIGNPGVGKSKMLEYMILVVPNSAMAVGGTMTGSGVTISMDTLPNRQKIPRAGIMCLCSGSGIAVDEMNQLEEEDLGKMYEGMENGIINYHKGGRDATLVADTFINGGANPKGYIYDPSKTIVDNVNLPAPLISRFDLILYIPDVKTETEQRQILQHMDMIASMGIDKHIVQNNLLNENEMMVFLNYAKNFRPEIDPQASKLIEEFHIKMMGIEQPRGSLRIDNRFPESIRRIATAYAKLHLSDVVTKEFAQKAIEIKKRTLRTFGMKTEEGELQMSMQDSIHGKEDAFISCFRLEQQAQEKDFIIEEPLLERMVKFYPKHFRNIDRAEAYFEYKHREGKVTKRAGRYKLD